MFERFTRRYPQPVFRGDVAEIDRFKRMLQGETCPACHQKTMKLSSFERGPKGFEAQVGCNNCKMHGLVNREGFQFIGLQHKDGKEK